MTFFPVFGRFFEDFLLGFPAADKVTVLSYIPAFHFFHGLISLDLRGDAVNVPEGISVVQTQLKGSLFLFAAHNTADGYFG
jgi:hypothetical protein